MTLVVRELRTHDLLGTVGTECDYNPTHRWTFVCPFFMMCTHQDLEKIWLILRLYIWILWALVWDAAALR